MTLKQMCEEIAAELTKRGTPATESQVLTTLSPTGETWEIVGVHREFCRPTITPSTQPAIGDLRSVHAANGDVLGYEAFDGANWRQY